VTGALNSRSATAFINGLPAPPVSVALARFEGMQTSTTCKQVSPRQYHGEPYVEETASYCRIAQSTIAAASTGTLAFQAAIGAAAPCFRAAMTAAGTGSAMLTPFARIRA
jgi:hypothetical protein